MLCNKCGAQNPDGAVFCSECGNKMEIAEPVAETEVLAEATEPVAETEVLAEAPTEAPVEASAEAPAEQPVAPDQPQPTYAQDAVNYQYQFSNVQFEQPAKKSKKPLIAIIIAVAVAACAALVAFNFQAVAGFFVKTFGSDEDYLKYVEKKALSEYTDAVTEYYGLVMAEEEKSEDVAFETQVKLTASDEVIDLAESLLGSDVSLDFIKNTSFTIDGNFKDNVAQMGALLNVNGQTLADLDAIVDMDNKQVLVAILNLSDKYLKGEFEEEQMDAQTAKINELLSDPNFKKALPSEKELNKLVDKYIEIALDQIDDVSADTETVKIDGVKQKLTVLEAEVDMDTLMDMAEAVLTEAKDDKEIKKIIDNVAELLADYEAIDDADEVYDEFQDSMDDLIDEIDDMDYDNETLFVLYDYVNSKHEIVGRKLEVEDQDIISYVTVRKGNEIAVEMDLAGQIEISGSGTDKKDLINIDLNVEAMGMEVGTISIIDYNTKKAEDGLLNGTIRIAPSKQIMQQLNLSGENAAVLALAEPALEFKFESEENSSSWDINLLGKGKVLVGINLSATIKEPSDVKIPSDSDVYDQENAEQWAQTFDLEKFEAALENSGLMDLIEDLMTPSYGGGYGDNYGYNDYDDYYSDYGYNSYPSNDYIF